MLAVARRGANSRAHGKRILFDTGDDAAVLASNVKAKRAGLGTTLSLGAIPRAALNQRGAPVLDDADSRSYRTLLAKGDDLHESRVSVRLARVQ